MISKELFLQNLLVENDDISRLDDFLISKGIFIHNKIKEKLQSFIGSNKKITYSQIASIYRYDKRIRFVLYKYISYLEEYLRSIILDNYCYNNNFNQDFWICKLKKEFNKYKNLEIALENLSFRDLTSQVIALPNELVPKTFKNNKYLKQNLNSLIDLRNSVMHNKFLLFHVGYKKCKFIDKPSGSTLRHNIYNLACFLPNNVSISLFDNINKCRENRNNQDDTKWDLPKQFIINMIF